MAKRSVEVDTKLFNAMFLMRSCDWKPASFTMEKNVPIFTIPLFRPDGNVIMLEAYGMFATPLSLYVKSLLGGALNRFVVFSSLDNDTQEKFIHLKLVISPTPGGKIRGRLLVRGNGGSMNFGQLKVRDWLESAVLTYNGEPIRRYHVWYLTEAEEIAYNRPYADPFDELVTSLSQCSSASLSKGKHVASSLWS